MNGPIGTREIRALGYTGKIVGVTDSALQSDIDTFTRAGATVVYPKPFDVRALNRRAMGDER